MAQVINTNTMSLNAQRNLSTSGASLATTIQRLSSGLRINSAKDDAAGLAISEKFSTQIRGANQAARNANDGISLAQTAEGALGEIGNNLQRIRELSVQSRNATNSSSDREALNSEVQLLKAEIQRVAEQTNFNGTELLNGKFQSQAFQIGADQGQTIDIAQIANANIASLGNWTEVDTAATMTGIAGVGDADDKFVAGSFSLTGPKGTATEIKFAAAGSAGERADQLVKAINSQSYNTGVTASLDDDGFVKMSAANGDFTIAAGTSGDGTDDAAVLAQTGLTAGTTEGATTGAWAAGSAKTGFADLDISTEAGADNAMKAMDAALKSVNSSRADLGAIQNRFTSVVANLNTSSENMSAARSRIRDVDYASETAELTRNQILQQAGTAMLAQANQSSQSVLSLLG